MGPARAPEQASTGPPRLEEAASLAILEHLRQPTDARGEHRATVGEGLENAAAARRRRTDNRPRELFNRRCNVEASIFQLCYHAKSKKRKYRGRTRT